MRVEKKLFDELISKIKNYKVFTESITTIPIGCIHGVLAMNMTQYKMDIGLILQNLIPGIIVAGLIVIGLWCKPDKMINDFVKFGKPL